LTEKTLAANAGGTQLSARDKGPVGLNVLSAAEMAEQLARGGTTSVALVEACLARIDARDPQLHAWANVDCERALAQARARDAEPRRSALHGVPIGIKDILDTFDMPTAYGSKVYKSHRPSVDSGIVALARRAGLVILGKCATTEFATPIPVGVQNPLDPTRSPGVSSSGSAAAVADYMTPLSVASQTGGSTILPASFCGIAGFKASLTALDRGGIRHFRPSLDSMGLMARHVSDIALLNAILTDSAPIASAEAVNGLHIGVCRTPNWHHAQPETADAIERATKSLCLAGADVKDTELPPVFNHVEDSFQIIAMYEGVRGMTDDLRDHLATMNSWLHEMARSAPMISDATYEKAQLHAIDCKRELHRLFERCDCILTPSACGEATPDLTGVSDSVFNRIWTLMHTPCVSVPAYAGPHGMPVGIQIVGAPRTDARTLSIAETIGKVLAAWSLNWSSSSVNVDARPRWE
jgi:Asp-tRNA(Asn)/Glu-tRNA(Gln) amidotransferase A subunit family amidase